MATTQADVDALNQAINDGVRSVTIGGQTTIYNTTDSLIRARDDAQARMSAEQQRANGQRYNRQTLWYYAGRGYDR